MHAMRSGLTRVASAPAVLAGAIAVLWWLEGPWNPRIMIAAFLLWAFLSGGVIDRYARGRPTRARGFFAACGAHVSAMIRLGLAVGLAHAALHATLGSRVDNPYVMAAAIVLLLVISAVGVYGQIRLVVEDRRSALGALLAGARFARRNPAALALVAVFAALLWGATAAMAALEPAPPDGAAAALHVAVRLAAVAYLALALHAAGVVLFQSRLAHAGYTAGPPHEWPDSPAAEAIANAAHVPR
ncbi:MAG TPA: hypothetical protein VFK57_23505 [Vicinamibacterales bacterium]|nr:hypothetical protein [Vicinamibacterales bacterium]